MAGRRAIKIRLLPAVVLVVLLALVTMQSWLDSGTEPLVLDGAAKGLTSITWAATVAANGRLAIDVVYDFSDDAEHEIDIRVPAGARYLSLDGTAISASIGVYATGRATGSATVSYELPAAVTRYRDGALLRLAAIRDTSIDAEQGLFACPRCYIGGIEYGNTVVYGAVSATGADPGAVGLQFIGLRSVRTATDGAAIRFVGIDASTDDVSMLATLPVGAATDLPIRDGTLEQALSAARAELQPSGRALQAPQRPPAGKRWAAITLTIILAAIIGLTFTRSSGVQVVIDRIPSGRSDAGSNGGRRDLGLLLLPATIAMGVIAIVTARGGAKFAWFAAIAGSVVALVTVSGSSTASKPAPVSTGR